MQCPHCRRSIEKMEEGHRHEPGCPLYTAPALEPPWDESLRLMQERSEVQEQIVSAISHYSRGAALHLVMGWMPLAYLKEIAPILGKVE